MLPSWWKAHRRRETALCLNSSYFGFYAHAGFLQGLHEIGLQPSHVSGASAGALVAGVYACGIDPEEIGRLFLDRRLSRVFYEWEAAFRVAGLMLNRRGFTGAFSGRRVMQMLSEIVGDRRIEDCLNPTLALSVANLTTGKTETARRGLVREFILASCAMPGLFQAQRINGDLYWDGGIADPVPFEHWFEHDHIRRIIVHQVVPLSGESGSRGAYHFLGALERSHEIISDELIRLRLELARRSGIEVYWFRTETPRLGPHRMNRGHINLELGRRAALQNRNVLVGR